MKNRGAAMVIAIFVAIPFGVWQESLEAALWMGSFLIALSIIKTVE